MRSLAAPTSRRRRAVWALGAVAPLLLLSCTSSDADGPATTTGGQGGTATGTAPGTASPEPPAAELAAPPTEPVVLEGATPGEVSVAASSTFFTAAPVAIVVTDGAGLDDAGLDEAAEHAETLRAPVLVLDETDAAPGDDPDAVTLDPLLDGELGRLGTVAVLAVGDADAVRAAVADGVEVVTDPAELPEVAEPAGADGVTVLYRVEPGEAIRVAGGPGRRAALATAGAAHATLVPVTSGDPREDPEAIAALAEEPPESVVAVGREFGPAEALAQRVRVAATGVELPGGGQVVFPHRRLVALYGHPGSAVLGVMGEQGVDTAIDRAREHASWYDELSDVPVIPTFEVITTIASASAGDDGDYSAESTLDHIRPWVERAGEEGMYVILDLQPGRTDFVTQAKRYREFLELPHVGLALDPEWRLKPDQVHLRQIGSVTAAEVNEVIDWLAELTARNDLPQKVLVLHQFRLDMIGGDEPIDVGRDEVAVLWHMDGQGGQGVKQETWNAVTAAAPDGVPFGWKNFYDEDLPMASPELTMSKRPQPLMVSYQ